MYTQIAQTENRDMMENQVKDCINGLFAARKKIIMNKKIPSSSRDEVLMLLHEAADLLSMRI